LESKETAIKLIVGLGNPGPQYINTRHNVGAWLIQSLCEKNHLTLTNEPKFKGRLCKQTHNEKRLLLFIPNTFMNESGQAVVAVAHFYRIPPQQILIAHDELDFAPGIIRLKSNGGHGGHNGLRDIINKLGSNEFHRIRIGIGRPQHSGQVSNYVLNAPSKLESGQINKAIESCEDSITLLTQGEFNKAFLTLHSE
jgi:peptidyl-tRNA hydrolase, PTH1 family